MFRGTNVSQEGYHLVKRSPTDSSVIPEKRYSQGKKETNKINRQLQQWDRNLHKLQERAESTVENKGKLGHQQCRGSKNL